MGYAAACLYPTVKELVEGNKLMFALLEPVCCGVLAGVVVFGNGVLLRSVYTALFTGLVLLLALEVGPIARLLSLSPFIVTGGYELDFYVFHQPCIKLVSYFIGGQGRMALGAFVLTAVLVYLWRTLRRAWARWRSSMR